MATYRLERQVNFTAPWPATTAWHASWRRCVDSPILPPCGNEPSISSPGSTTAACSGVRSAQASIERSIHAVFSWIWRRWVSRSAVD